MKCHVLHFDYSSVRQFKDDDDYNNGCDDDDDDDDGSMMKMTAGQWKTGRTQCSGLYL